MTRRHRTIRHRCLHEPQAALDRLDETVGPHPGASGRDGRRRRALAPASARAGPDRRRSRAPHPVQPPARLRPSSGLPQALGSSSHSARTTEAGTRPSISSSSAGSRSHRASSGPGARPALAARARSARSTETATVGGAPGGGRFIAFPRHAGSLSQRGPRPRNAKICQVPRVRLPAPDEGLTSTDGTGECLGARAGARRLRRRFVVGHRWRRRRHGWRVRFRRTRGQFSATGGTKATGGSPGGTGGLTGGTGGIIGGTGGVGGVGGVGERRARAEPRAALAPVAGLAPAAPVVLPVRSAEAAVVPVPEGPGWWQRRRGRIERAARAGARRPARCVRRHRHLRAASRRPSAEARCQSHLLRLDRRLDAAWRAPGAGGCIPLVTWEAWRTAWACRSTTSSAALTTR